jgi:F-type H+-transporting ATPase subunit b
MLEINSTFFFQIGNFLLLLLLLNIVLFRPIRRIMIRRDEELDSLQKSIEDYQGRSEQNEKNIEEGMVLARKDGFAVKEKLKGTGLEEEKLVLQGANSSVEEKLGKAKSEMEMKMADVRKALEDQVAGFSTELAEKILGRSI